MGDWFRQIQIHELSNRTTFCQFGDCQFQTQNTNSANDKNGLHSMFHCACAALRVASIHSAVRAALLESMGHERCRRQCDKHSGEHEIPDRLHGRQMHIQGQRQGVNRIGRK